MDVTCIHELRSLVVLSLRQFEPADVHQKIGVDTFNNRPGSHTMSQRPLPHSIVVLLDVFYILQKERLECRSIAILQNRHLYPLRSLEL